MPDKHQFTLKWLLVEVALLAIGIGFVRFFIVNTQRGGLGPSDLSLPFETVRVFAIPSAFGCFGAAIGGLFGRFILGMACGLALFFLVMIWLTLSGPYLPFR